MTQKQRMEQGLIYDPTADEIMNEQTGEAQYLKEYDSLGLGNEKRIEELLRLMLAECGENCYLQPPFYANWGGAHLHLGNNVYANFNLTAVDDGHIYIGDCTMIGPNVTIATACHPILPSLREKAYQFNLDEVTLYLESRGEKYHHSHSTRWCQRFQPSLIKPSYPENSSRGVVVRVIDQYLN